MTGEVTPSLWSIASEGSVLSIGSSYSVLSVGSVGSFASVGSLGSALSALSVFSWRSVWSWLSAESDRSVGSFRLTRGRWGTPDESALPPWAAPATAALVVALALSRRLPSVAGSAG